MYHVHVPGMYMYDSYVQVLHLYLYVCMYHVRISAFHIPRYSTSIILHITYYILPPLVVSNGVKQYEILPLIHRTVEKGRKLNKER